MHTHGAHSEVQQKLSQKTSVGVSAAKICLRQPPETEQKVHAIIADNESIVSLFAKMQKLLISSSLDKRVTEDTQRYDHNVSQPVLPVRDKNDVGVSELGR